MALIPCPACGRQMSTLAERCPHCGDDGAGPETTVPINGGSDEGPEPEIESSLPTMTMEALQGWFALQNPEDVWLVEDAGGKRHMPMTLDEVARRFDGQVFLVQHKSWELPRRVNTEAPSSGRTRSPSGLPGIHNDRSTSQGEQAGLGVPSIRDTRPSLLERSGKALAEEFWILPAIIVALAIFSGVVYVVSESGSPTALSTGSGEAVGVERGLSIPNVTNLRVEGSVVRADFRGRSGSATHDATQLQRVIYRLARHYTDAESIRLRVVFTGENRFGEAMEWDLGILSVYVLEEVSRYVDELTFLSNDISVAVRVVNFLCVHQFQMAYRECR